MGRHDEDGRDGHELFDPDDPPTEAVPAVQDVDPEQLAEQWRTELRNGARPTLIPPPAPLVLPDDRIERKVTAATLAAAGATALGAIATGVLDNLELLDGMPPWARFLIIAVFVPAAGAVAGYAARSNRVP